MTSSHCMPLFLPFTAAVLHAQNDSYGRGPSFPWKSCDENFIQNFSQIRTGVL